ncbi:RNA-binding (RRM/RBD/RNP motifs) family protein [Wolffia australiana]
MAGSLPAAVAAARGREVDGLLLNAFRTNLALAHRKFLGSSVPVRAHSVLSFFRKIENFYSFSAPISIRSRTLVASASSKRTKAEPVEPEDDFDEWEDDDIDEIDEDDDGSDAEVMPFEEMSKWLRNKPRGFGEGKTYDTPLEDKLMNEIEKSRQAQALNLQKLKSGVMGQKDREKKSIGKPVAEDAGVVGPRVRIVGLPRKKNVHRDLKLAFSEFPNIINISPAVEGNKKTRDPICKGFAFVDFKSDQAAQKFVETYSHQNVLFGKVEKQIICNIVIKGQLSSSSSDESSHSSPSRQRPTRAKGARDSTTGDKSATIGQNSTPSGAQERHKDVTSSENHTSSSPVQAIDLVSSSEKKKPPAVSRKKIPKTKKAKALGLTIQGSSLRLKVKERAVLTGVLSKYGGQAAEDSL